MKENRLSPGFHMHENTKNMWLHLLGSGAAGSPPPPSVTIFVVDLPMGFFFSYLVKGGLSPTPGLAYCPEALLGTKEQKAKPTFAMT